VQPEADIILAIQALQSQLRHSNDVPPCVRASGYSTKGHILGP